MSTLSNAFAVALLLSSNAFADYLVAHDVIGNEVRLFNAPCVNQKILATVPSEARDSMQRGQATLGGSTEDICYAVNPITMNVIVVFDDGQGFTIRTIDFKLIEEI